MDRRCVLLLPLRLSAPADASPQRQSLVGSFSTTLQCQAAYSPGRAGWKTMEVFNDPDAEYDPTLSEYKWQMRELSNLCSSSLRANEVVPLSRLPHQASRSFDFGVEEG